MKSDKTNPWRTVSTRIVYDNPCISIAHNEVVTPSGDDGQYGVVHYKNRAVGAVPYENGYIWLVGQTRYPLDIYSWEIPEGGCPQDEDPKICALRELQEETGITAETLTPLFETHLSNSVSDEWGIVYLATGLSFGEAELESTEDITVRKISLDDFFAEVEAGTITDSLSVTACYKLMLMKMRGELYT